MFTGLIQDVGRVESVEAAATARACGSPPRSAADIALGDSVAVNGVCLTATAVDDDRLRDRGDEPDPGGHRAGRASRPAAESTSSWRCRPPTGSAATSSRATSTASARSSAVEDDGFARRLRVALAPELLRYAVDKGSITLSGVSLTIAALGEDWVEVSLIPETLERTNLGEARAGKQAERRVRHRGEVRGAVAGTIRGKGAGVSQMTETEKRAVTPRRGRARSRRSRKRSRRSAAAAWSSSATAKTARTRATW